MASVISLGFLVMHARCWPYADDGKNLLKLGSEVALLLVFQATAVMRSALTRHDMVDAKLLREEDLTEEERDMPGLISIFMVLVSVLIPFTIFLYNKFKKSDDGEDGDDEDGDDGGGGGVAGFSLNPMRDGEPQEGSQAAGRVRQNET